MEGSRSMMGEEAPPPMGSTTLWVLYGGHDARFRERRIGRSGFGKYFTISVEIDPDADSRPS
ncbi:MAG: hypothetical protein CMJ34_10390 [Phycisphaerae bacterium]|nr:hypothetical protein [Phycisphaerae bacterium]